VVVAALLISVLSRYSPLFQLVSFVFSPLVSRSYHSKQPRSIKLYVPEDDGGAFILEDSRITVSHVDRHNQEIIFIRDLKGVCMSSNDDRHADLDYADSTSDKGGQSILFRSFADRQLFANIAFAAENEWSATSQSVFAPGGSVVANTAASTDAASPSAVVHRAEMVNSYGLKTEVSVTLDYSLRSLSLGNAAGGGGPSVPTILCAIDASTILLLPGSTKLEVQYQGSAGGDELLGPTGGGSTGVEVLNKVG
jgi:hypothetical protein